MAALLIDGVPPSLILRDLPQGASTYDGHKICRFIDPLPTHLHLELIHSIKFTQPPLFVRFFMTPSPLRCGHHIWKLPQIRTKVMGSPENARPAGANSGVADELKDTEAAAAHGARTRITSR